MLHLTNWSCYSSSPFYSESILIVFLFQNCSCSLDLIYPCYIPNYELYFFFIKDAWSVSAFFWCTCIHNSTSLSTALMNINFLNFVAFVHMLWWTLILISYIYVLMIMQLWILWSDFIFILAWKGMPALIKKMRNSEYSPLPTIFSESSFGYACPVRRTEKCIWCYIYFYIINIFTHMRVARARY